jgi:AcrR family transcriptional regulator
MERNEERKPRRRDAAATRAAILAAARNHFSCASYNEVGVRDIAGDAGVDPALVIRYFGSKENLFGVAVFSGLGQTEFFTGDPEQMGEQLARMLATKTPHGGFDPMLAIFHASLSPTTSDMVREVFDEQVVAPLAEWLGGEDAETRATLLLTQVLGMFLGRLVIKNRALVGSDPEVVIKWLRPTLQFYIDGVNAARLSSTGAARPD